MLQVQLAAAARRHCIAPKEHLQLALPGAKKQIRDEVCWSGKETSAGSVPYKVYENDGAVAKKAKTQVRQEPHGRSIQFTALASRAHGRL